MRPRGEAPPQVLVSFSQARRIIPVTESANDDFEASRIDMSPSERTLFLASLGRALELLEEEENKVGPTVLNTPQDRLASILQSHFAELAANAGQYQRLEAGGAEAKFDNWDLVGWAGVAWSKIKYGKYKPIPRPMPVAQEIPDKWRIAVLSDWGTGLYGAPKIADAIENDRDPFSMLLHLGDIYYSGTPAETRQRFLDLWPRRAGARSIALNGNHEMYSGGQAYFGDVLPAFGQRSSYLAFQNKDWLLVGLDTAYEDHDLDQAQVDWLNSVTEAAGPSRKVILFSHHQIFSRFDKQGPKLAGKLDHLLKRERIFAHYWGHEHLCLLYDKHPETGLLARCVGHAGMPYTRDAQKDLPVHQRISREAIWKKTDAKGEVPSGIVLDGENRYITGEETKFGPHGYLTLDFKGKDLIERVHEADGNVIYEQPLN